MESKRYFKVTNAEENHHGFQYVNGLNILNKPFEKFGSCVEGGLYFSDAEHILSFQSYGIYLREITLPFTDSDFKMVKDGDKWRANKIILGKRHNFSDVSTFELLISLGADITITYDYVIRNACENGHLEVIKFLIDKGRKCKFCNYNNTLKVAAENGHLEVVRYLIDCDVGPNDCNPDIFDCGDDYEINNGYAIEYATSNGHWDIVQYLTKRDALDNTKYDASLIAAATNGHLDIVKFLIKRGANNDIAICYASGKGHFEIVKFLIRHRAGSAKRPARPFGDRADPTICDNYALRLASENGHLYVVKFLVECGADLRADDDYAVQNASANGHLHTVKFLIERGADFRVNDDFAVRYASEHGHLKVVKYLVKKGADFRAGNNYAMRWASICGHLNVIKFLVNRGAEFVTSFCDCAQIASDFEHPEVAEFLEKCKTKRYFKITNADENHNGFQYVDGLNILDKVFEEEGSCVQGGLYFTDAENILEFIGYGIYLREITLPRSDPDFKMVKDPDGNKWRANKIILGEKNNLCDVSTIKKLISLGADLNKYKDDLFRHASEYGLIDLVKYVIDAGVNVKSNNNLPIRLASINGHFEVAKCLIEKGADVTIQNNFVTKQACRYRNLEMIKFLIEKGIQVSVIKDSAIQLAAGNFRNCEKVIDFLDGFQKKN